MTSGSCIAMELMRPNAIVRWRDLLGPTNTELARANEPNSIRARFGTGAYKHYVVISHNIFVTQQKNTK